MTVTTPVPARRRFHPLPVAGIERLTDDAVSVTFAVPEQWADLYRFRPGQALTVRRVVDGRDERRSYSICAPADGDLRIGVREVPGGLVSSWIVRELRAGDEVEVLPPSGVFTADLSVPAAHAFIVAGSGITPALSLASTVLRDGRSRVTVFYGNRRASTVMFADELADLKDRYPARLMLVHVLSREPRDAALTSGRLDRARLTELVDGLVDARRIDHWWLCGPHGLVQDARSLLADLGVPSGRVHQELFYVEDAPPPVSRHEDAVAAGPTSRVTLTMDGRSTTLDLPRHATVLDSAQKVRSDLPFACKGGVCGTCRARLTDGRVDMRRNYALEPDEIERGYVLTCQSVPASDSVTLDYDS